jgi:hypothetical protein
MRNNNDQRNKLIIKKEILDANFKVDDIALVIDNDEDLIKMWARIGLPTFKV